ncbi:MAG: hypothetical protein IKW63_03290 [Elusimicrobiaceae bacterium]|nr:hypothetical protein [Elusimicrobiaceae bacterium]
MKKTLALFLSLFIFSLSSAETVKLKDGTFLSGSIVSQTEYTLNLNTSYGPVVLNQREVEAILPDKHRVFLKGGSQLVGVIIDLDEFNMKLQTDEGTVNIDMPQIVSVEVYDYEQGETAKQTITQKQIQQQEALAKETARQATLSGTSAATAASGTVQAAGGLTFDSDIEKVFDVKKAEVVNGQVQTVQEISAADIRAQRAAQMSEEEAFLKGISPAKSEEKIQQTAEAARSGKLEKIKKAEAKKAKRPKDANSNKYFAITVGSQTGDLKLDNSKRPGYSGTEPYDVGGNGVRAEAAFLWRLKSSNLWLGPALAITNIPNANFEDLTARKANDEAIALGNPPPYTATDLDVSTSGQMIDLMAKANYYFNPDHLFSFYVTGNIGYRMLSLNYQGVIESTTVNSNGFIASAGLGVETHVDDMMLGLEVQEFFTPYSGQLKDSDSANTVISAKISWKF